MPGGVGGAELRGSPYPDHWHEADVIERASRAPELVISRQKVTRDSPMGSNVIGWICQPFIRSATY
jgi:hypothetical protein